MTARNLHAASPEDPASRGSAAGARNAMPRSRARLDAAVCLGSRSVGIRLVSLAIAAGCIGASAGLHLTTALQAGASATLASLMALIAWEDLRSLRVPDALNACAALAGLAFAALAAVAIREDAFAAVGMALAQGAVCAGALLAVREAFYKLRGIDGLGLGDVKLAAAAGIWLGWQGFAFAMLIASLGSMTFVGTVVLGAGSWTRERRIPFALALGPAIWAVWYGGELFCNPPWT